MCRNIKPLFNFTPPATGDEVQGAALQYVRKVSGFTKPSQANQAVFEQAVQEIAAITQRLIETLATIFEGKWIRANDPTNTYTIKIDLVVHRNSNIKN